MVGPKEGTSHRGPPPKYATALECWQMPNFRGNKDLRKLGKEY